MHVHYNLHTINLTNNQPRDILYTEKTKEVNNMRFIITVDCACGYSFNVNEVKVYGEKYPYAFCPKCNNKFFIKRGFYALSKS